MACPSLAHHTIFGISCNRQITSDELINKNSQVTRSTVQKAVVVLATQPIFGPMREKLAMVTRAYFAQRDLDNISLLEDFHATLEAGLQQGSGVMYSAFSTPLDSSSALYMSTSLREFVFRWRFKVLTLLKLLLLQRKVREHQCQSYTDYVLRVSC